MSEVFSCASRPIDSKIWINVVESAKSIAYLKTSYTFTAAKLQSNFEVLDSKIASAETSRKGSSFKKKLHREKKGFSRESKSYG